MFAIDTVTYKDLNILPEKSTTYKSMVLALNGENLVNKMATEVHANP